MRPARSNYLTLGLSALLLCAVATAMDASRLLVQASSTVSAQQSPDIRLIARVVSAEARGCSMVAKVAVGAVILNRVDDPLFPGTVAGVVYQPGAFRSVALGQLPTVPDRASEAAAAIAAAGFDPTEGATAFWNPARTLSRVSWSRRVVAYIDGMFFAY